MIKCSNPDCDYPYHGPDTYKPTPSCNIVKHALFDELVEALRKAKVFIEYARYELGPGKATLGDQFPRQVDADERITECNDFLARVKSAEKV